MEPFHKQTLIDHIQSAKNLETITKICCLRIFSNPGDSWVNSDLWVNKLWYPSLIWSCPKGEKKYNELRFFDDFIRFDQIVEANSAYDTLKNKSKWIDTIKPILADIAPLAALVILFLTPPPPP
jgi:hypothetical protein